MHLYYFADETNNSKFEEESNDGQEVKAEIVEDVKWFMVTDEDENVEEDIWEDITSPEIHAKVTAIQEANITRIETKEVEEESFKHDQWLDVTEGESWADIVSREIPLEDITVFEVARNLQWSDQVDTEYETETQPTTEQVHSVENLTEKVSQDTEMKEMETAEVQGRSEDNKEVAKEIKVLRLTWEELLLAERHMESAVVEDFSSDQIKSLRLSLAQEDPEVEAFKIMSSER